MARLKREELRLEALLQARRSELVDAQHRASDVRAQLLEQESSAHGPCHNEGCSEGDDCVVPSKIQGLICAAGGASDARDADIGFDACHEVTHKGMLGAYEKVCALLEAWPSLPTQRTSAAALGGC